MKLTNAAHSGPVYSLQLNYRATSLLTAAHDRASHLLDTRSFSVIASFTGHNYQVCSAKFGQNDKSVLTGGGDKSLFNWDIQTGKLINKWTGHFGRINSISVQRRVCASGSYDCSIKLWDLRDRKTAMDLDCIKAHNDSVSQVQLQGFEIISSSIDGCLKVHDIRKGEFVSDSVGVPIVKFAMVKELNAVLLSLNNSSIMLFDRLSGLVTKVYQDHTCQQFAVDLKAKDLLFVSGSEEGSLFLYGPGDQKGRQLKVSESVLSAVELGKGKIYSGDHKGKVFCTTL